MISQRRLAICLFLLRVSVFLVMLIWTLDKFVRPEHASQVFQNFYFMPAFGFKVSYLLGTLELILITGFLFGVMKTITYGAVLVFHAISTLSTFQQYITPFTDNHLLFFAAWPMLAACITLFLLREHDCF